MTAVEGERERGMKRRVVLLAVIHFGDCLQFCINGIFSTCIIIYWSQKPTTWFFWCFGGIKSKVTM